MESIQERNLIGGYFDIWLEKICKPTEKQKAVAPYLETIPEDFDRKLFDYIAEIQQQAYYAGFSMAMQLAADCYAECKKIIPRQ